jgi:hypothetical protein
MHAEIAWVQALAGKPTEARRILATIQDAATQPGTAVWLAYVHVALGDRDEAFKLLEQAYRRHDAALLTLATLPELRPLRSDPSTTWYDASDSRNTSSADG